MLGKEGSSSGSRGVHPRTVMLTRNASCSTFTIITISLINPDLVLDASRRCCSLSTSYRGLEQYVCGYEHSHLLPLYGCPLACGWTQ
jgi:hypothetical protein